MSGQFYRLHGSKNSQYPDVEKRYSGLKRSHLSSVQLLFCRLLMMNRFRVAMQSSRGYVLCSGSVEDCWVRFLDVEIVDDFFGIMNGFWTLGLLVM